MSARRPKNFKCGRCGAAFESNRNLQRHQARKKACDPILAPDALSAEERANPHRCRHCGRAYSRADGLTRHIRQSCKIANTEGGKEKAAEHALQRQLAAQEAKVDALQAQLTRLANLLEAQLAAAPARGGGDGAPSALGRSAEASEGPEPITRK